MWVYGLTRSSQLIIRQHINLTIIFSLKKKDYYFFHLVCFSRALQKTKNTPGLNYVIRTRLLVFSGKRNPDTSEM